MKRMLSFSLLMAGLCVPALAADTVGSKHERPIHERFAAADVDEVPSFRRHVLPLMGRLGCNGRACHGSFQGQGGFRLSLFGYDFDADMEALIGGDTPRADIKNPKESLILQKPTMQVDHGGEKRMEVDGWEYRVFLKWVENGCKGLAENEAEFNRLEVTPSEIVFRKPGETVQLKVVAHWSDGTSEDVTSICRFRTNDDATSSISETGLVKSLGKGDTHVVAFYDNGVVPVQVILPVSDKVGKKYPKVPTPTKVDELVVTKLSKLGVVPSELCTDDEFLRRVSLDMTGTLPTPEEIKSFMADPSPNKRAKKIDELLESPAYAAWWATKLCDYTGNNDGSLQETAFRQDQGKQWYQWIERRVRENKPYDEIVEGIVLAASRKPDQSFEEYCEEMSSYYRKENPADFTERDNMPHYWSRRLFNQPKEKALSFAYAFLGTRLQCAECHKHPFDQWTKQDFDQFTAFFSGVTYNTRGDERDEFREMADKYVDRKAPGGQQRNGLAQAAREGKTIPWREVFVNAPASSRSRDKDKNKNRRPSGRVITPKLLGGEEVVANEYPDPREALMDWMRSKGNPYFAKAFVNRVWASYFNVGITEPPDDMNLANPPSNEALLNYLTEEFVNRKYDMKWLHREITGSRTYQLSWRTNETNKFDVRNFSHQVVRRLPAEVAYDAIRHATVSDEAMLAMHQDPSERYIGLKGNVNFPRNNATAGNMYALSLFGRSIRSTNCDCDRTNEASLLQTIFLRNDDEVYKLLDANDSWLRQLSRAGDRGKDKNVDADFKQVARQVSRLEDQIQKARKAKDKGETRKLEKELAVLKKRAGELREQQKDDDAQRSKSQPALDPEQLVVEAYLRTVGRLPNDRELETARTHLAESEDTLAGMRDLMWALLNTKEFIVNR